MPSPPFKLAEHPITGRGNRFPYSQAVQRIDADSDFIEWGRFLFDRKRTPCQTQIEDATIVLLLFQAASSLFELAHVISDCLSRNCGE
jgi:hypothetical protein